MIKRITILLIVICFSWCVSNAQTNTAVGGKFEVIKNWFRGDDAFIKVSENDFSGAIMINIDANKWIAVQPELSIQSTEAYNRLRQTEMKLNYIHFPVMAKFKIPISKKVVPNIQIGPRFSYKFQEKYLNENKAYGEEVIASKMDLGLYDIGAVFGVGLDMYFNKVYLTEELRYDLGLVNLSRNKDYNLKSSRFIYSIGIGYKF